MTTKLPNSALQVPYPNVDLVDMWHVDATTGHRDAVLAGYLPSFFNQQWGGAPHYFELMDVATNNAFKFESATGIVAIGQTVWHNVGNSAGSTWAGQGFKVSQTGSYPAVWIRVKKIGNPANSLELRILPDDGTGKPSGSSAITNGTATAQSGKQHFQNTEFPYWVRFSFPTPPTLTAGTQYHITLKSSGAVDASNYWVIAGGNIGDMKYPHGVNTSGDATPTWANAGNNFCFLVENPSSLASLRPGGLFGDGCHTFVEGTPLNQSNSKCKDVRDIKGWDLTSSTVLIRGTAWAKDKTILDIGYALDHDRIVLRANVTTGFAQLDVYDSSYTKRTVTSAVDISSGNHDVAVIWRARGDGSDYLYLYIDGTLQGSLTSQTIAFDTLFGTGKIGTLWVGGGFALAPTWTQDIAFTAVPPTGLTYAGAATQGNMFSVSNGVLLQNAGGDTGSQDGYYTLSTWAPNNATGHSLNVELQLGYSTGVKRLASSFGASSVTHGDGTRITGLNFSYYYVGLSSAQIAGEIDPFMDFQHQPVNVISTIKGADAWVFANNKLLRDGTSDAASSATTLAALGDRDASAGESADVKWRKFRSYTAGPILPQVSSGASLSEIGIWNGNKDYLLPVLWNSGTPVSIKQVCGVDKNYLTKHVQTYVVQGVAATPSLAATTYSQLIPDMRVFCIGDTISSVGTGQFYSNTASDPAYTHIKHDGCWESQSLAAIQQPSASANFPMSQTSRMRSRPSAYFGLHFVGYYWNAGSGSIFNNGTGRGLTVEASA